MARSSMNTGSAPTAGLQRPLKSAAPGKPHQQVCQMQPKVVVRSEEPLRRSGFVGILAEGAPASRVLIPSEARWAD